MNRIIVGLVVLAVVVAGVTAGRPSSAVDAQDEATAQPSPVRDMVEDLQTRVAVLETQVAALSGDEAGASDEPRETPAATATQEASAGGPVGSRANPVPLGESGDVGGEWTVVVTNVVPDAFDLIMAENQFNEAPPEGRQFFMVTISTTYSGREESASPFWELNVQAVGASSVAYNTYDPSCGVIPNELPTTEVFQGGTVEGNVCWVVRQEDADSLVMFVEPLFSDDRVFFSLRPAA